MRGTRLLAVGGCLSLASSAGLPGAAAATVAAPCTQPFDKAGSPAAELKAEPWAQQKLNFEDAWQFTRGEGVKVAVIDSGFSPHPQLPNVTKTLDETKTGAQDCFGHGTEVAGIIGAQDVRSSRQIPFFGVAPGAEIISIKFAVGGSNNDSSLVPIAIRKAVAEGARVINLSIQGPPSGDLQSAVRFAHERDVLLVAAAGNLSGTPGDEPKPVFPAHYDGVISVGAIGSDGQLADDVSNTVTRVDVTAPGKEIISTFPQPAGSYASDTGTSFAVPFVAGTAALVRAHNPTWTRAQVRQAIVGTADGGTATGTGAGLVNPLRAVTAPLSATGSGGVPAGPASSRRIPILQPEPEDRLGRILALSITAGALTVALVVAVICVVVPEGRRRGWRPDRRSS